MLGERFVIVFPSGATLEADTVLSVEHSLDAEATKFPTETGAKSTDHTIIEPKTSAIEAEVSDTPLDKSLRPRGPSRANQAFLLIEKAMEDRMVCAVFTGLRTYPHALLTSFRATDSIDNLGKLVFSLTVQEYRETTATSVSRRVTKVSNHKPKAKLGAKAADRIKNIAAGKAQTFKP